MTFDEFQRQLANVDFNPFLKRVVSEIALAYQSEVKQRTPVGQYPAGSGRMGGTLRRNWGVTAPIKDGDSWVATVFNPTMYAAYVEYGHRTANHKGWVKGRFMMTNTNNDLKLVLPKLVEKRLGEFLRRVGIV